MNAERGTKRMLMSDQMRKPKVELALIYPFLALAMLGSIATLVVHISSLFGITYLFEHVIKFIGLAVFIVFLPTIFVMSRLTREFKQKDIWRAALRGCPQWMRRALWIILGYAWIGFFALPFFYGGGMDSTGNQARCMSAALLMFYLIPAAVLYSATRVKRFDETRRCLNGHSIPPLAKYCPECGAPAR
jgi:Na+/H+ antiporter NhaD/arsenite permease-like protein